MDDKELQKARQEYIAKLEADSAALISRITPDHLRAAFRRSAEGIAQLEAKARRTGRKVNGYTLEQLIEIREYYEEMASA